MNRVPSAHTFPPPCQASQLVAQQLALAEAKLQHPVVIASYVAHVTVTEAARPELAHLCCCRSERLPMMQAALSVCK